ncbi:dirigent protein 22-like [Miscanthus floridulus]|uniref:dirigent protein 22-like n=1 Tax=Miscanthus floridulus TaxID=154761 RepID=UPI003459AE63
MIVNFKPKRYFSRTPNHINRFRPRRASARAMAAASMFLLVLASAATVAALASAAGGDNDKETHIKLYWHDVASGASPTVVEVARAAVTNTSKSFFGAVMVIDDPLTEGPDLNSSSSSSSSGLLGRAQGTYISAGKDELSLLMNMNFVFQAGKYNGSSVAIMGRNAVFDAVREMAVVGGTGVFRMARGYAQARTHTFDLKTGDATVEYNLFIRQ